MTRTAVDVHEASGLVARLSPDGRQLAFLMLGSVFVADQATGRATAVIDPRTTTTRYDALAWAPDSRHLALLVSERPGTLEGLVVVHVASGRRRTVSNLADFGDVAWAPDGTLLVTRTLRDSVELRRYEAAASGAATVLLRLPRGAGQIALSPDGRRLAYTSAISVVTGLATPGSEIVEVDLATRSRHVLLPAGTVDGFPTFSPDGRSLAFLSSRSGSPQVWVAASDGSAPHVVASTVDDVLLTPLSWTPDSKEIVFAAQGRAKAVSIASGAHRELPFTATLSVARWSGLRRPALPVPGSSRKVRGISNPLLSPDGKSVVFSALGDLWTASTAGGVPYRLTRTPARDELPVAWAPDNRRIVYTALEPGRAITMVLDVTHPGSDAPFAMPGMPSAWSADGNAIAFSELPGSGTAPRIGWIDVTSRAVHRITPRGAVESIWFAPASDSLRYVVASDGIPDSVQGFRPDRRVFQAALRDSAASTEWLPPGRPTGVVAVWSADGRRVAWNDAGVGYWRSVTTGGEAARITDATPHAYSWSANGQHLLYMSLGRLRLLNVSTGVSRTLDVAPAFRVAAAPAPLVVRNVRLIDGRGTPPVDSMDVLIEGGRISRIGRRLTVGTRTRAIDGAGRTLLPGLLDMHVHLFGGGPPTPLFLHYGVTTVRDVGTRGEWTRSQRERAEQGVVPMPRIVMSAGQLTANMGIGLRGDGTFREEAAANPGAVRAATASLVANGADVIKIYWPNNSFEGMAIDAAHAARMPVTSHFLSIAAFARGLEGKEHSNFYHLGDRWTTTWREDALLLSKAAGTCITPTLVNYLLNTRGRSSVFAMDTTVLDDAAVRRFWSPFELWLARQFLVPQQAAAQTRWDQRFALSVENVRRMKAAGLRVAAGTDFGPPGWSLHTELELLVTAGFTPSEAIRAATLDAAACAGLDRSLGSIERGKIADLILVDGDPSRDIRDSRRIALVFLGGRPVSREKLAAIWTNGTPWD